MQSRVNGAGVTNAGDEKDSVGQDSESKPSEAENFRVERVPVPTGKIHNQEGQGGGTQRDDGRGGNGVAAGKAHVSVHDDNQQGNSILCYYNGGYESTFAEVGLAEEVCLGKEDCGDERICESGNEQRKAEKMPVSARCIGLVESVSRHDNGNLDYTSRESIECFCSAILGEFQLEAYRQEKHRRFSGPTSLIHARAVFKMGAEGMRTFWAAQ